MAHIYKKIMKAEHHEFFYCKNRHNSKESHLIVFKGIEERWIGSVNNKTGVVTIKENHGFKKTTIDKLLKSL